MKTTQLTLLSIFLFILQLGTAQSSYSQDSSKSVRIIGSVVNEQDEIVKGAAILIKQTTSGTVSDLSGNFSISIPSLPTTLTVSFIGYDTEEIQVKNTDAPLKIRLKTTKNQPPYQAKNEPAYQVLDSVEEMPLPVGGRDAWHSYVAKNIKYPANDRKAGIQGVVVVTFQITPQGKVDAVELLRGIGGESDQEAMRVISEAPDWIPARQNGQPIAARMRVPILFRMDSNKTSELSKHATERAVADEYGKYFVVVGYSSPSSTD
jgi:TonB family protein